MLIPWPPPQTLGSGAQEFAHGLQETLVMKSSPEGGLIPSGSLLADSPFLHLTVPTSTPLGGQGSQPQGNPAGQADGAAWRGRGDAGEQ